MPIAVSSALRGPQDDSSAPGRCVLQPVPAIVELEQADIGAIGNMMLSMSVIDAGQYQ